MTAFNRHCDLVLSPDDVWLTILAQFCAYVNKNAEGLRNRIVEHEGKKELTAYANGSLESANYQGMIRDLLVEIRKNIKSPELADWFRPGFSTTTEKDEVCAAATAMASLQAYFDFTMQLLCGIPSVTMLGTVADWKLLREKVDRLLEFEVQGNPEGNVMELWVGYLRKACDGFVESAENPNSEETLEFWDTVGGDELPCFRTLRFTWVLLRVSNRNCFSHVYVYSKFYSHLCEFTLIHCTHGYAREAPCPAPPCRSLQSKAICVPSERSRKLHL